jgi:hypothetical protein
MNLMTTKMISSERELGARHKSSLAWRVNSPALHRGAAGSWDIMLQGVLFPFL